MRKCIVYVYVNENETTKQRNKKVRDMKKLIDKSGIMLGDMYVIIPREGLPTEIVSLPSS
jgi:hypothetical protein